jgi:hypothetical protein
MAEKFYNFHYDIFKYNAQSLISVLSKHYKFSSAGLLSSSLENAEAFCSKICKT